MDYSKIINKKAAALKPSGIRKYFDIAAKMENVISLGVGEPDFRTPWAVRREAIKTLERGKTTYTANPGLISLRQAISEYIADRTAVTYDPDGEIIVTVGGSEAIDLTVRAIVEPGDEVIIPEPSFVCYRPIVELTGGVPITLETRVEDCFKLRADDLKEKITEKTKLIILPYPNNPTGAVMTKDDLEPIAELLRGTDIMILTDEIYAELTYGDEHFSIISLPDMKERTIYVNGFSKTFAMTGWRLGYMCGPREILKHALKIHQFGIMSSPTVSQYAAIEALKSCDEDIKNMVTEYDMRRRYLVDAFNKLGLSCFTPQGAFYVFPCIKSTGLTSDEFCERLLYSKKVAVVPGTAFGECGEGYIRVSYAYSRKHLSIAIEKIAEFLEDLKNAD